MLHVKVEIFMKDDKVYDQDCMLMNAKYFA